MNSHAIFGNNCTRHALEGSFSLGTQIHAITSTNYYVLTLGPHAGIFLHSVTHTRILYIHIPAGVRFRLCETITMHP